jgi:hypothetical protein
MNRARIAIACSVFIVVVAAIARAGSSKDDASNGKRTTDIKLNDPAPYCNRGRLKQFCSATDVKKQLAATNDKLRKDMQLWRQADARHFRPFGFDAWNDMYLEGEGVEGRHFALTTSDPVFPVKKDMVLKDSNNCESPSLQIKIVECVKSTEPASCTVQVTQGTSGLNICGQEAGIISGVQIVKGYWDGAGNWQPSDTEVTLSCNADANEKNHQQPAADGALARCLRYYRYKPSSQDKNNHLTACIRMQRGDFCGNGTSLTYVGTYIDAHDPANPIDASDCSDGMCFEATWSARGAECVGHPRFTNLDYEKDCGAFFTVAKDHGVRCRKGKSISQADLFTRSRTNTCGGNDTQSNDCGPDNASPGCQSTSDKKANTSSRKEKPAP